ncbi:MAG: hypothetical protein AW07_00911 [Candidatus Accumulibacter sp. SK-11]|nr:MAG: hypothetical protein AW07_00911 [Candidatus Accumulibacter sp. SK-11]
MSISSERSLLAASSSGSRAMSRKAVERRPQSAIRCVAGEPRAGIDGKALELAAVMRFDQLADLQTDRVLAQVGRQVGDADAVVRRVGWWRLQPRHLESLRPAVGAGQLQPRIVKLGKQREGGADRLAGGQPGDQPLRHFGAGRPVADHCHRVGSGPERIAIIGIELQNPAVAAQRLGVLLPRGI